MGTNMEKILNPDYEICLCRHIKTRDVISIIKKNDITSLRALQKTMKIGDKCGGCRNELSALIDHFLDEEILMMDLIWDD